MMVLANESNLKSPSRSYDVGVSINYHLPTTPKASSARFMMQTAHSMSESALGPFLYSSIPGTMFGIP
jgi:hypothetical protein